MSQAKVKRLTVTTPQGSGGTLVHDSRYTFRYETNDSGCAVSLLLPVSAGRIASSALPPIFSMNRPEGWLRERLQQRFKDRSPMNDMRVLRETGQRQIGRLRFQHAESLNAASRRPLVLSDILDHEDTALLFEQLALEYEVAGVSGVQPKVLVPVWTGGSGNEVVILTEVIIKAGTDVYPHLAINEFICLEAARRAGLEVPRFWLSNDGSLFVIERFDRIGNTSLGFEDMSVLMGKTANENGNYKYEGSYESIAQKIDELCSVDEAIDSKRRLFEYVALSVLVRNGDAHLKNFGLRYDHPARGNSPSLAPLYDVVTTSVYNFVDQRTGRIEKDRTLALKLCGSTSYPTDEELMRFGHSICGVANPDEVMARIRGALRDTLASMNGKAPQRFLDRLVQEWGGSQTSIW